MDHSAADKQMAEKIAELVANHGGQTYYVGGFVRDALLNIDNKDIDIEVHGIDAACLGKILDTLGNRITIGESFGIYNLKGYSLDIAMPRKEQARGQGHKDFDIFVDPFIGTEGASRRRDFTMNALMQNVRTGEITDHFGGVADLRRGVLRHVDSTSFSEDPLRVLRAAQFAARFHFTLDPETVSLCQGIDLRHLPKERILGEVQKGLLKADSPSLFFEILREMKQLDVWFPQLKAMIGTSCFQEEDCWNYTMRILDETAKLRDQVENPLFLSLSALALGLRQNNRVNPQDAQTFLTHFTNETKLIEYVLNMTALQGALRKAAATHADDYFTTCIFDQAVDPQGLICLVLAEARCALPISSTDALESFLSQRLALFRERMSLPYVMGRDLIAAGLKPGAQFTQILTYAHDLRLRGIPKEDALKLTLAYAEKKNI